MTKSDEEYLYLSSVLVCGDHSSRTRIYKVFNLDIFKKNKDLSISISKSINKESRIILLGKYSGLYATTSKSDKTGDHATLITYADSKKKISLSDTIFNEDEFELAQRDVHILIDRKIRAVANLIKTLYHKDVALIPLLINDFPNISRLVLDKSEYIFS